MNDAVPAAAQPADATDTARIPDLTEAGPPSAPPEQPAQAAQLEQTALLAQAEQPTQTLQQATQPAQAAQPAQAEVLAPAPGTRTNPLAVVALIGVFILGIIGVLFGHIALSKIKRTGERGRGIALFAVLFGYVRVTFTIGAVALLIATGGALMPGGQASGASYLGLDTHRYDELGWGSDGYDAQGYDRDGYDAKGYDRKGYDAKGYDRKGYNAKGYNAKGYDAKGYNAKGYNAEGYNAAGYNVDGYNRDGFDASGYDREGYDQYGFNAEGYNRDGFLPDGRSFDEIQGGGGTERPDYVQGYRVIQWAQNSITGEWSPMLDCSETFGAGETCYLDNGSVRPFGHGTGGY